MREQATLSRRSLAALPLAALMASTAAAVPAPATGDDAALLEIGGRWRIACAALHAHDLDCVSWPDLANDRAHDALGERLFTEEQHLFDLVMATPARTLQGLEVKGQALARAFDVLAPGTGPIETARERAGDIEVHSAHPRPRHPPAGEDRSMSAVILAFPRPSPVRALYPVGGTQTPFTAAWCEQHLPLIDAAMDLLSADDVEFDRRYQLMKDQDGRAMLDELAGQLERLGAHVSDVADGLGLTAARIRNAMTART